MSTFLCISLFFAICIIFIMSRFNQKYKNTAIHLFIKRCFKVAIFLLPFIWYIFIKDLGHYQWSDNANGSEALGLAITILISPFLVISSFLLGHVCFIATFMCIHHIFQKIYGKTTKFMPCIILSVLLMIILLELIWWGIFSSEKSIPLRIYTWNIVILTFPWFLVIGTIIIQKWKSKKWYSISQRYWLP